MRFDLTACNLLVVKPVSWWADWAWGVPLVLVTVVLHVFGLGLMGQRAVRFASGRLERDHPTLMYLIVVSAITLWATIIHAIEAAIWASAYRTLGALPDLSSAMLYSISALTSYGHAELFLAHRWQLLGAIEPLDGWLLFGLSTAFLFAVIGKVWLLGTKPGHH
jgi:hypothetical protein